MELQQQFEAAALESKALAKTPGKEELLELYALYKQATEGDVIGDPPTGFDFKAIAKHDAWNELKGKPKEQAMKEYIALVAKLKTLYS